MEENSQGIRRSKRLQEKQKVPPNAPRLLFKNTNSNDNQSSSSPGKASKGVLETQPKDPKDPKGISSGSHKRKADEPTNLSPPEEPVQKQLRSSNADNCEDDSDHNPVKYWVIESNWPKKYFEADPDMDPTQLKRKRQPNRDQDPITETSESSNSQDRSQLQKSRPYASSAYPQFLEYKGGYMYDSVAGMLASEKEFCKSLMETKQTPPIGTLFDNQCFLKTLADLENENEAGVVIDLLRLIVPSARILAVQGIKELKSLEEHIDMGWDQSIPVQGPRPQPDFSVGFRFNTFSEDQFSKLNSNLFLEDKTYFAATSSMFFPFLTTEVKCCNQAINIADRQNAHSMTVALRGVIALFRKVGRAQELHRKVLGFSISFDNTMVRVYAHYPEIDDLTSKCYRHKLAEIFIVSNNGQERWMSYQFVRNIYESFAPLHLERIKGAIDQLTEQTAKLSGQSGRGAYAKLRAELEDYKQQVTDLQHSKEMARFREDAARRGEEEAKRQVEEVKRQMEEAKVQVEEAKVREKEAKVQVEEAEGREKEANRRINQLMSYFDLKSKSAEEDQKV